MKIFSWYGRGVLESWSTGLIVCIAKDLESAIKVIDDTRDILLEQFPNDKPTEVIELGDVNIEPKVWFCHGSD